MCSYVVIRANQWTKAEMVMNEQVIMSDPSIKTVAENRGVAIFVSTFPC